MSSKLEFSNADNLSRLYQSGKSIKDIADVFGVSPITVRRRMIKWGIPIRSHKKSQKVRWDNAPESARQAIAKVAQKNKITIPNIDAIIERYIAGESELSLAKEIGVSRPTLRSRLVERGVTIRNGSDANRERMKRLSPEDRKELAKAAHDKIRGSKRSKVELIRRAVKRQETLQYQSEAEKVLIQLLRDRGVLGIVPQKAIGPYNIDIAIEGQSVAVEVMGHSRARQAPTLSGYKKRTPYLLNLGWDVIIVRVDGTRYFLTEAAADYIVSHIQEPGSNKSARGQYRVIGGNGELMAVRYGQLEYWT